MKKKTDRILVKRLNTPLNIFIVYIRFQQICLHIVFAWRINKQSAITGLSTC